MGLDKEDDDDNMLMTLMIVSPYHQHYCYVILFVRIIVAKMAGAPFWLKPENSLASVAAGPCFRRDVMAGSVVLALPANQRPS